MAKSVSAAYLTIDSGERVELEDDKLYRVVTDFYSSQMLGGVTEMYHKATVYQKEEK